MAQRILSNIPLERIFQFAEVGYLKSLLDEILKEKKLKEYNFYVYFKKTVESAVAVRSSQENEILIITGDESSYIPHEQVKEFQAVFKTYLPYTNLYRNLFHLPVGPNPFTPPTAFIPYGKRTTNVFFTGNLHVGRKRLYRFLISKKLSTRFFTVLPFSILHRLKKFLGTSFSTLYPASSITFTAKFNTGMDKATYSKVLGESRIVLCPPGNPSGETFRHFEALRAGCIVVSEKLPSHYCYRNSPIIMVDSWEKLDKVVRLCEDEIYASEISEKSLQWYQNNISEKATVKYIVNCLNNLK
jgi:hypothetical protein